MDVDDAMEALEDEVQEFTNDHRHRAAKTMTPDEWEREFRAWQDRNPLRGYHAANREAARVFDEISDA